MHDIFDHFKTLNETSTSDHTDNLHINIFNEEEQSGTRLSIYKRRNLQSYKELKCNKVCGSDAVLNEFIITTVDIFLII